MRTYLLYIRSCRIIIHESLFIVIEAQPEKKIRKIGEKMVRPIKVIKDQFQQYKRYRHLYHNVRADTIPPSTSCSSTRSFSSTSISLSSSTIPPSLIQELQKVRNIGIAAHIDAGKTTATERMLFYSGYIPKCGEVHDGDTITDFLPQERDRGITIKAAAITFGWNVSDSSTAKSSSLPTNKSVSSPNLHTINFIDTPGHVDFTIEVERSFRVLDGCVLLYDAVNGVEAQSETVWSQACRYNVSRIAFANKMDREGASYEQTAESMKKRLHALPLCLHVPLGEAGGYSGFLDLVNLSIHAYEDKEGKQLWNPSFMDILYIYSQHHNTSGIGKELSSLLSNYKLSNTYLTNDNIQNYFSKDYKHVLIPGRSDGNGFLSLAIPDLIDRIQLQKEILLEQLANLDNTFADDYLLLMDDYSTTNTKQKKLPLGLNMQDYTALQPNNLRKIIRNIVCTTQIQTTPSPTTLTPVPLLCGSAYKFKGIQHLLDNVVHYLPSPLDRPPIEGIRSIYSGKSSNPSATGMNSVPGNSGNAKKASKGTKTMVLKSSSDSNTAPTTITVKTDPTAPLRAFAFKVQNHPTRGPLVFFRVYSGVLLKGATLLNTLTHEKERPGKILQMLADEQREVESIMAGHIGAATGLKHVKTGDTLCNVGDPNPVILPGVMLPQPVFTASLEVYSPTEQKQLEDALPILLREDPSLHLRVDTETGQTLLSGM